MTARFEVGKVYNIARTDLFCKVIKRNDETGYVTVQYCDRDGTLWNGKYSRKISIFRSFKPVDMYEHICISRGGGLPFCADSIAEVF